MAKQIIILENVGMHFDAVFWAVVPATRQAFYASANARSRCLNASQAEVDALKAGEVVEKSVSYDFAPGTSANDMMANAVADFASFQAEIDAKNPWALYGSSYDGATWSFTGVA